MMYVTLMSIMAIKMSVNVFATDMAIFPCNQLWASQNCLLVIKEQTTTEVCDIYSTNSLCSIQFTSQVITSQYLSMTIVSIPHAYQNNIVFLTNNKKSTALKLQFDVIGSEYFIAGCEPTGRYHIHILTDQEVDIDVFNHHGQSFGHYMSDGVTSTFNHISLSSIVSMPNKTSFCTTFVNGVHANGMIFRSVNVQKHFSLVLENIETGVIYSIPRSNFLLLNPPGNFNISLPTTITDNVTLFNCKQQTGGIVEIKNETSDIQIIALSDTSQSYYDIGLSGDIQITITIPICAGFAEEYSYDFTINNDPKTFNQTEVVKLSLWNIPQEQTTFKTYTTSETTPTDIPTATFLETSSSIDITTIKMSTNCSSSCTCGNYVTAPPTPSIQEVENAVMQIKLKLKVNKTKLTKYWLKKNCANDDRPSAIATGYVGLGFICFIVLLVILIDISPICLSDHIS